MFNKALLEFPRILLSCGEVEIPLNRQMWKERRGLEEMKRQEDKEKKKKKKLHKGQGKEEGSESELLPNPEESLKGGNDEDSQAKTSVEEAVEKSVEEATSTKANSST